MSNAMIVLLTYLLLLGWVESINGGHGTGQSGRARGPKKTDRIAIIGAGASGLHMGYTLKKLGYSSVTLFEKENRVGGNAASFKVHGVERDLGIIVGASDYFNTKLLLSELFCETVPFAFDEECTQAGTPTSLTRVAGARYYKLTGRVATPAIIEEEFVTYTYYQRLYYSDNGSYDRFLSCPPSDPILQILSQPTGPFLLSHNMTFIYAIEEVILRKYGYQTVDTLPLYYTFMMMTSEGLSTFLVKESWSVFFQRMATNLNVQLSVDITKVERNSKVKIYYTQNRTSYQKDYDFLILANGMQRVSGWLDMKPEETTFVQYFEPPTEWLVSVVCWDQFKSFIQGCTAHYPGSTIHPVTGIINPVPVLFSPSLIESPQCRTTYQITVNSETSGISMNASLVAQLDQWYGTSGTRTIVASKNLFYSPFMTPEGLKAKIPWTLWNIQGKYKTWYIGASLSVDMVEVLFSYNLKLLHKFALI